METMRYQENKKSYKGVIFGFFVFVILGIGFIYFAIKEEKEPIMIGNNQSETQSLRQTEKVNSNIELATIIVNISDKTINDDTNSKLKCDITVPEVSIASKSLEDINSSIYNTYFDRFTALKETMQEAENKFTYKVTYENYDNIINGKRVISLVTKQTITDVSSKKITNESITTYNIDVEKKDSIKLYDVLLAYQGADYKSITKNNIKEYLVSNNLIKEDEFLYTLTGLENYYIKDSKVHIVFNSEEIISGKHEILDIEV